MQSLANALALPSICPGMLTLHRLLRIEESVKITNIIGEKKTEAIIFLQLSGNDIHYSMESAREILNSLQKKVGYDIVWLSKIRHPAQYNIMALVMSRDGLSPIDNSRGKLKKSLELIKIKFIPISKIGWHDAHEKTGTAKTIKIKKDVPKDWTNESFDDFFADDRF